MSALAAYEAALREAGPLLGDQGGRTPGTAARTPVER